MEQHLKIGNGQRDKSGERGKLSLISLAETRIDTHCER